MKIHDVEINLAEFCPGFEIKIDGVVLEATCGVLVQSPMESGLPHTVVTIKIPANVRICGKAEVRYELDLGKKEKP